MTVRTHRARRALSLGARALLLSLAAALLSAGAPAASPRKPAASANPQDPALYAGSDVCAACHEERHAAFLKTPHGAYAAPDAKRPVWLTGCESCHGPGKAHADAGGDPSLIRRMRALTPAERSDACLQCHGGQDERINFRRSEHAGADVSCDACHAVHDPKPRPRLLRAEKTDLCLSCHGEVRASFAMPFHHRVPEKAMDCVDCHNQHGGFTSQQRLVGTDQACLKCHGDKQGPFTYEHLALRLEGCVACHTPHGSDNPRLLTRSEVRFLCLECHSGIEGTFGVGTPSFHNLANPRYFSCTTCHVMIHGSNLNRTFFE